MSYFAFPLQQWLHERLSSLRCTYISVVLKLIANFPFTGCRQKCMHKERKTYIYTYTYIHIEEEHNIFSIFLLQQWQQSSSSVSLFLCIVWILHTCKLPFCKHLYHHTFQYMNISVVLKTYVYIVTYVLENTEFCVEYRTVETHVIVGCDIEKNSSQI